MDVWQETDTRLNEACIPFSVIFELTRRCNVHCVHCYNVKDRARLTCSQAEKILAQLRLAGCLFVTFTGGEVFTHPDFLDILACAREKNFDIKIISNGTLITAETARHLKSLSVGEVRVSLHGAGAETHENVTGVKGSFEKALKGISALKDAGISVHLNCTLMQQNVHEFRDIQQMAEDLDIRYNIDPLISPKDDGSTCVLSHRLPEKEMADFYMSQFPRLEKDSARPQPRGFPCDAGRTFAAVSAEGYVYPCIQLPFKLGSVFEQDFGTIWRESPVLKKIREARAGDFSDCKDCGKQVYCSRCQGLAYIESGDIFGAYSMDCFMAGLYQSYCEHH